MSQFVTNTNDSNSELAGLTTVRRIELPLSTRMQHPPESRFLCRSDRSEIAKRSNRSVIYLCKDCHLGYTQRLVAHFEQICRTVKCQYQFENLNNQQ